ncbi:hypothetical protein CAPTEDRAFT_224589 [Capitella teleta]|uniref:Deoxynucleoside kinase domain-containing protein n=1 Tax=Capitella teleta TaxID=283909 RepID=R7VA99_CAPTE|nr:hypothetical protein CAPTEDRAFT_224589 [Capitella teleta]|eukprot:ELU15462.1 hypothetical protein CAPTEDRAFT_224589 [Capitella teleta]
MAHAISRGLPSRLKAGASILKKGVECPALCPERWVPVATLIPTHGAKYEYAKPWNYRKLPFNMMRSSLFPLFALLDYPRKRLNPNSKLIIVEGNIGVGKNEFAQRLAKEFDLVYVPSVSEKQALQHPTGFDLRDLNDALNKDQQFYDLTKFYADAEPSARSMQVSFFQALFFLKRCYNYAQSIQHILSTGQGVVLTSSVYGDAAYTHALKQMNVLQDPYVEFNKGGLGQMHNEAFRPHATIYLDAPVSTIRERINARNDPREVKSAVLSDNYIQAIEDGFKTEVLPKLQSSGELFELDWSNNFDENAFKEVVRELSELNLEHMEGENRYKDWDISWFQMNWQRRCYAVMADDLINSHSTMIPEQASEHPAISYAKGWSPELGNKVSFKLW